MTDELPVWNESKKILVILAHPDDPEFFCGGTLTRWARQGHSISYLLLTRGDKGSGDPNTDPEELARLREREQNAAAAVIGAKQVCFLHHPDGLLVPDLALRREIVQEIRRIKPDILVTCDPQNMFPGDSRINHPDHRAAGQAAVDAAFPASGNPMFYPDMMVECGLAPHSVEEVWLSYTSRPNVVVDVTDVFDIKLRALHEHASQIGDPQKFDERMRSRRTAESSEEYPRYEEKLTRIVLR